jgi:hypothetical protein
MTQMKCVIIEMNPEVSHCNVQILKVLCTICLDEELMGLIINNNNMAVMQTCEVAVT